MSFGSVQSDVAPCRYFAGMRCYSAAAVALVLLCGCRPGVRADSPTSAKTPGKESTVLVASDWPLFRGNATATGVAEGNLPNNPQLLWKYTVPKGSFESTPVVANGVAYIGDMDGNFCFLDAKTGDKKCTAKAEAEINSAANFHAGNVLFGSQDATLYCLDAKSGEEKWKHQIGDQIRCSPTVIDDRCFLAGCDGKLHVINLANGEEAGDVEIGAPTGATPAAAGSRIYFGTEGATFFCIDWKQLKEIWHW